MSLVIDISVSRVDYLLTVQARRPVARHYDDGHTLGVALWEAP